MPAELNIEKQIQEAMARGEFDNLKGRGKPLDLDAYFATPEDLRMAFSLLKSNEFVPEEVDLIKDIAAMREALATESDEARRAALSNELQQKQLALNIALEKYRKRK